MVGKAGPSAGPLSSCITWRYHSPVTDCCTVHIHAQCEHLWFSKSNYTWAVPTTEMGENPISAAFKDSRTQILASIQEPRGLHDPVQAHVVYTGVGSLSPCGTHSLCANAATKTSALAPKLRRAGLRFLCPGIRALKPAEGHPLRAPQRSRALHPALPLSP